MKIEASALAKFIFIIFLVVVVFTGATDADVFDRERISGNTWKASTLDFTTVNSFNNQSSSVLFNTNGIIPGGFGVESVRIKKEGKLDFNFRINTEKTIGDDPLFNALTVRVMQDWQLIHTGKLKDLQLDATIKDGKSDLVFFISLESTDQSLTGKTCDFDFVFTSWRGDPNRQGGFKDQEKVGNHLATGLWQ